MPLSKTCQEFSSNQCKASQNAATGFLQLMHKDAGALGNLLCGILIPKNNSSTLYLSSFLSIIALLHNPFFSLLLCEEKNLVFPFAPSLAHPLCLGACSTFQASPSVRKVLCLHPRGKAAWSGMVAGIPSAPPHPRRCPGREHRAVSPFWLLYFISAPPLPRQHVILCGMLWLLQGTGQRYKTGFLWNLLATQKTFPLQGCSFYSTICSQKAAHLNRFSLLRGFSCIWVFLSLFSVL